MKWLNLDFIKKTSLYITPDIPDSSTVRYRFSVLRVIAYVGLYTIFAWMILILILSTTPLKNFLFVLDNEQLKEQREKITELQAKVETLSAQLQNFASINARMKYALELGQKKDSLKPEDKIYDTLKQKIVRKIPFGGNLLAPVSAIIKKFFDSPQSEPLVFQLPAEGVVVQTFDPVSGHMGIDFGMRTGSPIYASAGGIVLFADYTIDYGFSIIIQHDRNFVTVYRHCSSLLKTERDFVKQGELIALSGNSGKKTTGPHLHFEIWQEGKPVDPAKFINY